MEVVSRANAAHYVWGGVSDGWHLLASAGLSVIEERVPPGGAEVAHRHFRAEQFFYVLAGRATMELGERRLELGSGEGLAIPPGIVHRLRNEGREDLRFLVVSAPPSHGDRIFDHGGTAGPRTETS